MAGENGLLNPVQMPDFNIMGLLLGGRGYASNWFGQRDQLKLQQGLQAQEASQRAAASKGILASDQFRAAMANPQDEAARFGLWGQFQGAGVPGSMADFGNTLTSQALGSIYQQRGIKFSDELERSRIQLSASTQLKMDEIKRARDMAQQQQLIQDLTGPDPTNPQGGTRVQSDLQRSIAAKQLGLNVPEGYVPGVQPQTGALIYKPAVGTKPWQEAVGKIQAARSLVDGAKQLEGFWDGTNNMEKGTYEAMYQDMFFTVKRAEELGALDKGTSDEFQKTVPAYSKMPDTFGTAREKLRGFQLVYTRKAQEFADQAIIDPASIPNRNVSANVPEAVPDELAERRNKAAAALSERQNARGGGTRTGAFAPTNENSIWGPQGSGSGSRTGR